MRFPQMFIVLVLGIPLATPADAQRLWYGSIGGGPSVPVGQLSDEVGTGYHAQATLGFRPSMLPFGIRLEAFYQDFDAVEREPSIHVARGGEWYRQVNANVSAVVNVPTSIGPFSPYALLGAGWIRAWHDDITYSGERNSTVSLNAGAGVDFSLLGAGTFLEVRYMGLAGGEALRTGPPAVHPEVDFRSIPVTFGVSE